MRKVYVARRNPANLALDRPRALIPHSTVHESRLYCLAAGLVSGIKNQRIKAASRATDAMLRNTVARPKLAATRPNSEVLSEAPIPDAVPTMPWAKLKRPLPLVRSAMTSAVSTPSTCVY